MKNRFSLQKFWERERRHHQEVTPTQKDLENAKSLVKQSSQQNQEHLTQLRKLSEEKQKLRAGLTETDKESQSIKDTTQSEKTEICELRKKNLSLHGSVEDKEKSVDLGQLTLDRSVSQVQRLPATSFARNRTCFYRIPKILKILILHVVRYRTTDTSLLLRQQVAFCLNSTVL